jgi:hypothetical protein
MNASQTIQRVCCALPLLLCGAGCGEKTDDWQDPSLSYSERRNVFVDSQTDAGMTELEAKHMFHNQQVEADTLGSWRGVSVDGDDVADMGQPE